MRLDKNIIDAVKAVGHDRIVIQPNGVFSCKVDADTQMGDKATVMRNASIVYGSKSIIHIGDTFITAPYVAFDLREKATKEQVKEVAESEKGDSRGKNN